MADPKEVDKIFRQIATWELANVPQVEIARLLEVDEPRISQLMALPGYQKVKEEVAQTNFDKDMRFNDAWDLSEEKALRIVHKALENSRDGDYALRVAAVANRAHKRGFRSNGVLNAQQGMRAVVSLPMAFVTKIESAKGEVTVTQGLVTGEAKPEQRFNVLKPAGVEQLFSVGKQKKDEDILEGVDLT